MSDNTMEKKEAKQKAFEKWYCDYEATWSNAPKFTMIVDWFEQYHSSNDSENKQRPVYNGRGNHSVNQLEAICEQFQIYCNQLLSLQKQQESDAVLFVLWLHNNGWTQSSDHRYHYEEIDGIRKAKKTKELYQLFKLWKHLIKNRY